MKNILKALGPGILFASTAIGVSHLVQSTRAGADFGFTMLWAVLAANLFKYPFFEFGSRYANATGESLINGYRKLGVIPLFFYFVITLISMFLVSAAVIMVTAGFMQNLFGIASIETAILLVIGISAIVLFLNNFKFLDSLIKTTGIILLISTIIAFILVIVKGPQGNQELLFIPKEITNNYWLFIIPLMGWMPTAVDLSTWNSLWTLERIKQTGYHPKLRETLFDFRFGYIISALLSLCFLTLGAFLLFGTNTELNPTSGGFANQVIGMYTTTFGNWAKLIMAIAAFSIMFGTSIGVMDGYSRAMNATLKEFLGSSVKKDFLDKRGYQILLLSIGVGSFFLIFGFLGNKEGFGRLVNLATSISFILAPLVAIMNWILVQKKYVDQKFVPGIGLQILSILGILFLVSFSILYLVMG